jgi:4-amino-4-deoxy-L-arabinose transferase-like glycosyltransferase
MNARALFNIFSFRNIGFALIVSLALFLRLHGLGTSTLWYDEASCAYETRGLAAFPNVAELFNHDELQASRGFVQSYSLFFVQCWRYLFGVSEVALRSSSVLFSLATIILVFLYARRFLSLRIAYCSMFLLAISPIHIYYAQELRPYSAVALCAVALLYFFMVAATKKTGGRWLYWIGYIGIGLVALYFHVVFSLFLIALFCYVLVRWQTLRHITNDFLITHVVILVGAIPLLLSLYPVLFFTDVRSLEAVLSEFPMWNGNVYAKHLFSTLQNFSAGYTIATWSWEGLLTLLVSMSCFFLACRNYPYKEEVRKICIIFFVAIFSLFSLSLWKSCYVDRYLFFLVPLGALLLSVGIAKLKSLPLIVVLLCFCVLHGLGLVRYYANQYPQDEDVDQRVGVVARQDIRELVQILVRDFQDGDSLVHTGKVTVFPLKFYTSLYAEKNPALVDATEKGFVFIFENLRKEIRLASYDRVYPAVGSVNLFQREDAYAMGQFWVIVPEYQIGLVDVFKEWGGNVSLLWQKNKEFLYKIEFLKEDMNHGIF